MTTPEVNELKPHYNPRVLFDRNPEIKKAIEELNTGFNGVSFRDIGDALLSHDTYMVLADFNSYKQARKKAEALYADAARWNRMGLVNTANAGRFAADRAIREYAENIWNASPLPEDKAPADKSAFKKHFNQFK
jgi:starch phosphorylase